MAFFNDYLLFDGAMGTYFAQKTGREIACELVNLLDPKIIAKIHAEYISAGATALKTNTFGANTTALDCPFEKIAEIIRAAWQLATKAAADNAVVFADIGPITHKDEESLPDQMDVIDEYKKIVDEFRSLGCKHFLFETFTDYHDIEIISAYIKQQQPDAYIIASYAVAADRYTLAGVQLKEIFQAMASNPYIDAHGLNCLCGPAHMFGLLKTVDLSNQTIIALPNASYPSRVGGRTVYIDNPSYFAGQLLEMKKFGIKIIGGCCGTTPEHIRLTRNLLSKSYQPTIIHKQDANRAKEVKPVGNPFREKLLLGEKVIIAELDPPHDTGWQHLVPNARALYRAGADAVSIVDSPLGRARVDSILVAASIQRQTGLTAIPHLTCRDRNTVGMKSALLGLYLEELRNVLVVTGDPIPEQERGKVKGFFHFNSYTLLKYLESINEELFTGDPLFCGAAVNINAANFDHELTRCVKKIENGASFLMTQPIFTEQSMLNLQKMRQELPTKIIGGLMLIGGYKGAVFAHNEIPGVDIPKEVLDLLPQDNPQKAAEIGLDIAKKIARSITPLVDGYFVMPTKKNVTELCELITNIKSYL
ncbi:MAG: bifunctional homocysteine S-methyltransferase/methylenetetrahydrofolate reductase [Clostridia bacterium]|nr:bifunctional homocysteine S-methyltransferase/methylenetetrahydrofolate reductase [Clostridia bacterium]